MMFDYYLTADDVIANSIDNMSDEDIDRDLRLFKRIAQRLGIRNYNDLIVVPGEEDYNPEYYAQPLGIFSANLYKNDDSIKVWSFDGVDFVAEELNGTLYLYFRDENTASKYKDMIDKFNNDYAEDINESVNTNRYSILSRLFSLYPDISEEDEDYLNNLGTDELIAEIRNRGWEDIFNESLNEDAENVKFSRTEPHDIVLSNDGGKTFFRTTSYGEGWENGYHVRSSDKYGGKFIDEGSYRGISVGDKVSLDKEPTNRQIGSDLATIISIHIYPNGKADYLIRYVNSSGFFESHSYPRDYFVMSPEGKMMLKNPKEFNESLNEDFLGDAYDFLDSYVRTGESDYVDAVMDKFGVSPNEANRAVDFWVTNSTAEWHDTADIEDVDESLDESIYDSGDYYTKVIKNVELNLEDNVQNIKWDIKDNPDKDSFTLIADVTFSNGEQHTFEFEGWRFTELPSYISYDIDMIVNEIVKYMKDEGIIELDPIDYWEVVGLKQVQDSDGFWTDYTMYYNKDEGRFVCIFGDRDLYDPTNTEPDFECETEREAKEWFDDYDTGEMEGEDDTIYESKLNEAETSDKIKRLKARLREIDREVKNGEDPERRSYEKNRIMDELIKLGCNDGWYNDEKITENLDLNESMSQYYKIGDPGSELVYVVSAIRYSNETNSTDPYASVYMTLVCGWDYCSDWSDKMGWVDPDNWVEDVQTDYFIVYLADESIEQALADNGYTPTSKPSPIYHYNEEKDRWEIMKESLSVDKYIRESLNELDHRAINEDTKFYDLRSLYEATKLNPQQKQELKKVIDSTDDAEIIAAAIGVKTKNEDFDVSADIDSPENNYSVSAFLSRKGYQNYYGLYEDLWTDDLSEAEHFIWESLQNGFYVEFNDYTTIKTKGYTTTKYFNPDELDETTSDYSELEESVSSEKFTPIEKQMRTERGLIYVKGSYPSREAAKEAGYDYAFHSRDLGKDLFSRITKDINHREFVIVD